MASMVAENWEQMDDSESFELSPRNHNFLMSLLDETQVDECDDERLKHVIRSLEAEIDCTSDFALDDNGAWESDLVDCESSVDESNGRNSSVSQDDLDLQWMDIEIVPSGDVDTWYMDHMHGQGNNYNEFGGLNNFSCLEDYGSQLWHETNAINRD